VDTRIHRAIRDLADSLNREFGMVASGYRAIVDGAEEAIASASRCDLRGMLVSFKSVEGWLDHLKEAAARLPNPSFRNARPADQNRIIGRLNEIEDKLIGSLMLELSSSCGCKLVSERK